MDTLTKEEILELNKAIKYYSTFGISAISYEHKLLDHASTKLIHQMSNKELGSSNDIPN